MDAIPSPPSRINKNTEQKLPAFVFKNNEQGTLGGTVNRWLMSGK